jgi:hypothetical protein
MQIRKSEVDTEPKLPRYHCWRFEQVYWAANALQSHHQPVNPPLIRALFDAVGVCTEDRGNQWIGDALGAHGLHLPKDSRGNYILPPEGIGPELIVEWLLVDELLPIDPDLQKFWPAAAALSPPQPKQPRKAKAT